MDLRLSLACLLLAVITHGAQGDEGSCTGSIKTHGSTEVKLYDHVMTRYRETGARVARPLRDSKAVLNVKFGLNLVNVDMDEEKRQLNVNMWVLQAWKDDYLTWDASSYDGIDTLNLQKQEVWRPDIVPYNCVGEIEYDDDDVLAVAKNTGDMLTVVPAECKVQCKPLSDNSFSCPLKFGSWVYGSNKLDLNFYDAAKADTTYLSEGSVWTVKSADAKRNNFRYPGVEEDYPNLEYTFVVKK